jgi:hypothetical protein
VWVQRKKGLEKARKEARKRRIVRRPFEQPITDILGRL